MGVSLGYLWEVSSRYGGLSGIRGYRKRNAFAATALTRGDFGGDISGGETLGEQSHSSFSSGGILYSGYFAEAYDRVVRNGDKSLSVDEKSQYILSQMGHIVETLNIPTSLKIFDVPESDLEGLVEAGMQVTRLLVNNMREITADDARAIYQQVL